MKREEKKGQENGVRNMKRRTIHRKTLGVCIDFTQPNSCREGVAKGVGKGKLGVLELRLTHLDTPSNKWRFFRKCRQTGLEGPRFPLSGFTFILAIRRLLVFTDNESPAVEVCSD